ncbi:hypothetical protein GQX73_g9477 [Xylaria multiplex]|uniref:O-methyltransferase C-terminal domain-containing protein n=1 Tax=Xylaria multiplex TaxID=323545 RepID=A0A7C8IHW7_9PEZI|nr:hypothetical protein GQX73_g9477 [Xylaria multiplex]
MAKLSHEAPGSIVQLAATILENTRAIDTFLKEEGLPGPSLHPNAPATPQLSAEVDLCLQQALASIDELTALLLGPLGWLKLQVGHVYNMVSLHALYRFSIPTQFSIGEEASIRDVSMRCSDNGDAMSRILQHAVTNRFLAQPRPGYIAHSACSTLLSQSPALMDWVGSACEDLWPAASQVIPALLKWPELPALPSHTAFNVAENTDRPFFQALASDPQRTRRFASAMGLMQSMPGFEPLAALDAYDWASLRSATVIDVGGSDGAFATALKRKYPTLRVIVQDLPGVIESTRSHLDAAADVILQAHNFFDLQPAQDVDVYFFRLILHDWPDEFCSKILRQLIPTLKPGTRIIVNDLMVPPLGSVPIYQERQIRCQDLAMLALFNSKERSREEWTKLITATDTRFRINSIIQVSTSPLGLLEIVWTP